VILLVDKQQEEIRKLDIVMDKQTGGKYEVRTDIKFYI
jgi:hypothetical protein